MRESYAYVLLKRKTDRLRKETGNTNLRSIMDTGHTAKKFFIFAIVRPIHMLFFSPIVFLRSLYAAIIYGYLYLLFTTIPQVFETQYGISQGDVGLAYLSLGVGSVLGLAFTGAVLDRLMKHLAARNAGERKPECRLPPMVVGTVCVPLGLFWYG